MVNNGINLFIFKTDVTHFFFQGIVELLNDPANYIYYNEILGMLHEFEVYDMYENKLRLAAYNAMKTEAHHIGFENE